VDTREYSGCVQRQCPWHLLLSFGCHHFQWLLCVWPAAASTTKSLPANQGCPPDG